MGSALSLSLITSGVSTSSLFQKDILSLHGIDYFCGLGNRCYVFTCAHTFSTPLYGEAFGKDGTYVPVAQIHRNGKLKSEKKKKISTEIQQHTG